MVITTVILCTIKITITVNTIELILNIDEHQIFGLNSNTNCPE